jgi:hypothetical protein
MSTSRSAGLSSAVLATLLAAPAFGLSATRDVARKALPFMADDYQGALATARAQSKPIFLEAWAPW